MKKIAIIVRIRRVNRFIKEWLDHHLKMGVDTIFVADNNQDNDKFDDHNTKEYLNDYIKSGRVIYWDYRNKNFINQERLYLDKMVKKDFKLFYAKDYEYFSVLDSDEWLDLCGNFSNIKEWFKFLENKNSNFDEIVLNWWMISGSDQIEFEPENSIWKTYGDKNFKLDLCTKKITKSSVLNNNKYYFCPHAIAGNTASAFDPEIKQIDCGGNIITPNQFDNEFQINCTIDSHLIKLKHFQDTSLEAYVCNRCCTWAYKKPYQHCLDVNTKLNKFDIPKDIIYKNVKKFCNKYELNFNIINNEK